MVYRKTPDLSPEEKATMLLLLRADKQRVEREEAVLHGNVRTALKRGLTMAEIGKGVGVSSSTVGRWSQSAA